MADTPKKPAESRQAQRHQQRIQEKQQKMQEKFLNAAMPRREGLRLMQEVQRLKDQAAIQDISLHTLRQTLLDSKIITEKQLKHIAERELEKFKTLQEIQKGGGDFDNRLALCKKHNIPPEETIIPAQLQQDPALSESQKRAFVKKYGIPEALVFPEENKT